MSKISYKLDVARISGNDLINLGSAQITKNAHLTLNIGEEILPEFMKTRSEQQTPKLEPIATKDAYDDIII